VVIGTLDGGETWGALSGRLDGREVLLSVWIKDAEHGLVVGAFGYAATTADGGKTWERRDDSQDMVWRPFYFATLIVDPTNPRSAMEWYWPESVDLRGYHPVVEGDPALIEAAARLIIASERPVIYAGGGILKARGADALRALAEMLDIPVVTTLMARGAIPDDHPLCLGMPGMHGNYTAVTSMQESDLLIALGSRFDDRVTGKLDGFAPEAKIIHVDIDPAELGGSAWEAAIASFLFFALGAVIPVLPYVFLEGTPATVTSAACGAAGLFLIGVAITLFTGQSALRSGLRQTLFGVVSALITFGVGHLIGVSIS